MRWRGTGIAIRSPATAKRTPENRDRTLDLQIPILKRSVPSG
jgi:hypothetical protein